MTVPEEAGSVNSVDDLPQNWGGGGSGEGNSAGFTFQKNQDCGFYSYCLAVFTTQFLSSQDLRVGATAELTPSI